MKKYIIDGYNLLKSPVFKIPPKLDLEGQRDHLIRLLNSYSKTNRIEIIIIFDNSHQSANSTQNSQNISIQVKFTRPNQEADDLIIQMIRKTNNPHITIVSSDLRIRNCAQDHQIPNLSSEQFCKNIQKEKPRQNISTVKKKYSKKEDPYLSKKELQYWKEIFSGDSKDE